MARIFLKAYVALNILALLINVVINVFRDEVTHFLSTGDWLIFIIACGSLAITETLEKMK